MVFNPTEKQVESRLVTGINRLGGKAIKLTLMGFRFMPDRMCLFPKAFIFFIEVKKPDGRLMKGQIARIKWLRSWGFIVYVVSNYQQVDEVLNEINITITTRS